MPLDVYFKSDIENALRAAEWSTYKALVGNGEEPPNEYKAGYEAGYRAALATIALAFGLVKNDEVIPSR